MRKASLGVPVLVVAVSVLVCGCPLFPAHIVLSTDALAFLPGDTGQQFTITNTSIPQIGSDLTVTVTSNKPWLTVSNVAEVEFLLPAGGVKIITARVRYSKANPSIGAIAVVARDAEGAVVDDLALTVTTGPAQYFTEGFNDDFDLVGKMVALIPSNSPSFYRTEIADLPEGADTTMRLLELGMTGFGDLEPLPSFLAMDPIAVTPLDGKRVWLYGQAYGLIYVHSDGRVTFGTIPPGDKAGASPLERHFAAPGVSALFTQFGAATRVYALQARDRLILIYVGAAQLGRPVAESANSFQIELLFDDQNKAASPQEILLSWFEVDDDIRAIVGPAFGGAVPADYVPADLTEVSVPSGDTRPIL